MSSLWGASRIVRARIEWSLRLEHEARGFMYGKDGLLMKDDE